MIIAIYAPSGEENVNEKDDFFEKLNDVIAQVDSAPEVILISEFNGRIGKQKIIQ